MAEEIASGKDNQSPFTIPDQGHEIATDTGEDNPNLMYD